MKAVVRLRVLEHGLGLEVPRRQSAGASCVDLRAAVAEDVTLPAGRWAAIPSGVALAVPQWLEAQVRSRSGLALRDGVFVMNSPGTIDSDYRGEIVVVLANLSSVDFMVRRGDRIAQLAFCRVERPILELVAELDETERGSEGLGSTGKK